MRWSKTAGRLITGQAGSLHHTLFLRCFVVSTSYSSPFAALRGPFCSAVVDVDVVVVVLLLLVGCSSSSFFFLPLQPSTLISEAEKKRKTKTKQLLFWFSFLFCSFFFWCGPHAIDILNESRDRAGARWSRGCRRPITDPLLPLKTHRPARWFIYLFLFFFVSRSCSSLFWPRLVFHFHSSAEQPTNPPTHQPTNPPNYPEGPYP